MLTPYDIHIGEWVYGHHTEGSDDQTNGSDIYYPVCVETIKTDGIETTDGEVYDYEQLSPIPFNGDVVKLFDWPKNDSFNVCRNWQTEERFIRYYVGNRRLREKTGLKTIHEVQQWYYDTYKKPLVLKQQI